MTTINYINLSLELWGCVISAIVAACILLSKRPKDKSTGLYFLMLFLNTCALLFDVLALCFRGRLGIFAWWGVRVSNFIAFSSNAFLLGAFALYLMEILSRRVTVNRRPIRITVLLSGVLFLLEIATQFLPITYSIDAQNIYHRESLFWVSHAIGLVGLLLCARTLFRHRRFIEPEEKIALWCYMLLPIVALCVQAFVYGIVLLGLANTVSLIVIFLFLQAEQGQRMAEQARRIAEHENQLTQSRISIMLSQLQPHFLYNVLNSIYHLCEFDPAAAQQATKDFSIYLRANMDSLTRKEPVAFSEELRHLEIYLSLEKMRFPTKLNIVYDLQATGFMLPALTVQPLVENAVKYGICQKDGGGTLTISTRETSDSFQVVVSDDGAGYDPGATQYDGRTHVGIENVRGRLSAMSGGSLEIQSTKGVGTVATITIPKEDVR